MDEAVLRQNLRLSVCADYPWLVSELFDLEGALGWGPGFREYDDGEFFPPPLQDAEDKLGDFLEMLSGVEEDMVLYRLIDAAEKRDVALTAGRLMLLALTSRRSRWDAVIVTLYSKIAVAHSPYVLGGARMYLSMWQMQKEYALAAAGLVRLLYKPMTRLQVRAESVRRKKICRQFQTQTIFPVEPSLVPAVQREVCCVC